METPKKDSWPLEIKQSEIEGSGRGVFVTQDIPQNVAICYYHGYRAPSNRKLTSVENYYMLGEKDGLIGYIQPKTKGGVAQLINDAYRPNFTTFRSLKTIDEQILFLIHEYQNYVEKSAKIANVGMVPSRHYETKDKVGFMTFEPIKSGRELFFSYGFVYWTSREYVENASLQAKKALVIFEGLFHLSTEDALVLAKTFKENFEVGRGFSGYVDENRNFPHLVSVCLQENLYLIPKTIPTCPDIPADGSTRPFLVIRRP